MNKITQLAIDSLTQKSGGNRLTIYMPTHKISTPPTIQEDRTRYKNMIREAHEQWLDASSEADLKDIFDKVHAVHDDESFWQETTRGLAIFADHDGVEFYSLPIECEERVYVGDHFDLTPLHIANNSNQEFYVLALAMHEPKLYKADAYNMDEVEIDLPESMEKALNIDELHANSQTQRAFKGAPGSNSGNTMHGNGDSSEAGREERLQYFRIIDAMLSDSKYVDTRLPILIAATDNEAGDYKAHSKLDTIMQAYLPGNHTKTDTHVLHDQAWELVDKEICQAKTNQLVEKFNEAKGAQKASSDIDDIHEAVKTGRVDSLLVCMIDQTNDTISDTSRESAPLIRFDEQYDKSDIQSLAASVVEQGGKVIGVDHDTFDVPSMVAAVYRY